MTTTASMLTSPLSELTLSPSLITVHNEISKNVTMIQSSTNSIVIRNALKEIQLNISNLQHYNENDDPKAKITMLIQIVQGSGKEETSMLSLGLLLLNVMKDEESSEICRERSALCLKDCLNTIFLSLSSNDDSNVSLRKDFLQTFYIEYSSSVYSRFGFTSDGHLSSKIHNKNGRKEMKTFENSEEIRLIMIQISSLLVQILGKTCMNDRKSDDDKSLDDFVPVTGMLCQVVAKCTFIDPYPELKRESCSLVKYLGNVFPHVVLMNEDILINAILGVRQDSHNTSLVGESSQSISDCLIKHRHGKIRSLGLETVVDILNCHNHVTRCHSKSSFLLKSEGEHSDNFNKEITAGLDTTSMGTSSIEERLLTHILPRIESSLLLDHSSSVRISLTNAIGKIYEIILGSSFDSITSNNLLTRLVIILLFAITDEVDVVKKAGVTNLNDSAKLWLLCAKPENTHSDIEFLNENDDGDRAIKNCSIFSFTDHQEVMTFNNCVSHFMCMLVESGVIHILLVHISSNVSVESKKRYLDALGIVFQILTRIKNRVAETNLWDEDMVMSVVSSLSKIFSENEDDDNVFSAALSCAREFGSMHQSRSKLFSFVLAAINDDGDKKEFECDVGMNVESTDRLCKFFVSSPSQYTSVINIISQSIQGWRMTLSSEEESDTYLTLQIELSKISNSLCSQKILDIIHLSSNAACSLLSACNEISLFIVKAHLYDKSRSACCNKLHDVVRDIVWCCVNLLGCPESFRITELVLKLLQFLSSSFYEKDSFQEIIGFHFHYMVRILVNDFKKKAWKKGDTSLLVFDALIRYSSVESIGQNFDYIIPIFEGSLGNDLSSPEKLGKHSKEQEVLLFSTKIFFMALVESILSRTTGYVHYVEPFVERLLQVVVIPNLIWQVGGMAAALRKLSAAVLFTILKGNCASDRTLFKLCPQLLPVLKCNITDDDSSMRELAVSSMGIILGRLPKGGLGEEAMHQIYPDLMKCLDDSSESVRYLVCDTMKSFLKCAPVSYYKGTAISYIVENLFVHLDDPDNSFKEKVYEVLIVAIDVNADEVIKRAKVSLLSHSSRLYCDLLLQYSLSKKGGVV